MRKFKHLITLFLFLAVVLCSIPLCGITQTSASITGQQKTDFGLSFNNRGKFRIMQLADIQDYYSIRAETLETISRAVKLYSPDLIVLTGDNIVSSATESKFRQTVDQLKGVFGNTPFAVTFGNHDSESGPSRSTQYSIYNEYGALDFDNNFSSGDLGGVGTGCIPIRSSNGTNVAWNVVLFDSGTYDDAGGYGKAGYKDTKSYNNETAYNGVVNWFRSMNETMRTYTPDGGYAPTLAFQHIPLREIYYSGILVSTTSSTNAFTAADNTGFSGYYKLNPNNSTITGLYKEPPCASRSDTLAMYKALADKGNVKGIFYGHDHKNTFMGEGTINADGRNYNLVQGYCKGTTLYSYNDGDPGVRIFDLDESTGDYSTFMSTLSQMQQQREYYVSATGDCIYELGTAYSRNTDSAARGFITNLGYTLLEKDLNAGCSGASYVYMGYKKRAGSSGAITAVRFYKTTSSTDKPETITSTVNGVSCTFRIVNTGEDVRLNLNINSDTSGTVGSYYIYTYYTTDPVAPPINDIVINTGSSRSGYTTATWFDETTTAADLNKGCGGSTDYIYLHYKASYEPVTEGVLELQAAYSEMQATMAAGQGSASGGAWANFTAKYNDAGNVLAGYTAPLYTNVYTIPQLLQKVDDLYFAAHLLSIKDPGEYFYYPAGTQFYSQLATAYSRFNVEGAKKFLTDDGYTVIDKNLNDGCNCGNEAQNGGTYIYFGYKPTTDYAAALKAVRFFRTDSSAYNSSTAGNISSAYAGRTVSFAPMGLGTDPYLNLNRAYSGTTYGTRYIYGYQTAAGKLPPITDIVINNSPILTGYTTAVWFDDSYSTADLNYGVTGSEPSVYVHYKSDVTDVTSQYNAVCTALTAAKTAYDRPVGYYTTATRNALHTAYDSAAAIKAAYDSNYANSSYNVSTMEAAVTALNNAKNGLQTAAAAYQSQSGGEWLYASFTDAIAGVYNGGTVRLLADVSVTSKITITKSVNIVAYGAARNIYRGFIGDDLFVVDGGTLTLPGTTNGYALTVDCLSGSYPAPGNSCVVFVISNGTFNMYDGVIIKNNARNEATNAGTVLAQSGTLNIYGGKITGCANTAVGAMAGSTLNLTGGEISGNTPMPGMTGGVVVYSGATINLSGSTKVTGNTGGNIYLGTGVCINLPGTYTGTAGITVQSAPTIALTVPAVTTENANAAAYIARFIADNASHALIPENGNISVGLITDITLRANNGTSETALLRVTTGTSAVFPSCNFSKTGYTFGGWYKDSACTMFAGESGDSFTVSGYTDLYAKWDPVTFTVNYNGNGNTGGTTPSSLHTYDTAENLNANSFTKTGYTFEGWALSSGGDTVYTDSQSVMNLTSEGGASVTLFAKWTANTYIIGYDLTGGTPTGTNPVNAVYDTPFTITYIPEKQGGVFKGWLITGLDETVHFLGTCAEDSRSANGTSITTGVNDTWFMNLRATGGNVKFTAIWEPVKITVTLNGNGATNQGTASVTATYGAKLPSIVIPARTYVVTFNYNGSGQSSTTAAVNYPFTGYYTSGNVMRIDASGTGNGECFYTADTELTARWNSAAVVLPVPEREGYTFAGWYTDSSCTRFAGNAGSEYTPSENVTLYAKWIINNYTVRFFNEDGIQLGASQSIEYGSDATPPAPLTKVFDAQYHYTFNGWTGYTNITANTDITATFTPQVHSYTGKITTQPTCLGSGIMTYTCSCGRTYREGVDALGHDYVASEIAPACETEGYTAHICSRCGDSYSSDIVAASGHIWDSGSITTPAACLTDGVKTFTCSVCSQTRTEAVTKLGHDYIEHEAKDSTCTEQGCTAYKTCSRCDYSTYSPIASLGHDYITHTGKAATCNTAGWKAYQTCSRCDYSSYSEIPALGHSYVSHEAKSATCTEKGWNAYQTCSRCDYTSYSETNALGHDYAEHGAKTATCTENGWNAYLTCSRCSYTTYKTIPALGHAYETHGGKAATCTSVGWKAYQTCSRCNYSSYSETPALGHDYIDHAAKTATCTEKGWNEYQTCSRCSYSTYAEINALGHDYRTAVTAPTCTEKGYTEYTCTRCSDTYTGNETAALGHQWDTGVVTTAPTCTVDGEKTFTCTVCLQTKTEAVTKLGHDYIDHAAKPATCIEKGWGAYQTCSRCNFTSYNEIASLGHDYADHEAKAATCTEKGWDAYSTCSRCDFTSYSEIAALGHDYIDHAAKAAACTEKGWDAYRTCSRCDFTSYSEIAALGHDYIDHAAEAATCTEKGWDAYRTCSRCDFTSYNEIASLGHDYIDHAAKAATCTENGWDAYRTCSRCDFTSYNEIVALGHDYKAAVTAPTCTADGFTTHTCSHCGDSYTDSITAKLGHDYKTSVVAPTCTEKGYTTHTCSLCADTYVTDETAAAGHKWNNGVVTTSATCTVDGVKTFTCTVCDAEKTEVITAPGHSYSSEVTSATCTEDGFTTHTCASCGDTYRDGIVTAPGHTYKNVVTSATCTENGYTTCTCSVCGYVTVKDNVSALGHTGGNATCCAKAVCTRCSQSYGSLNTANHTGGTQLRGAANATCTANGYTGDTYCLGCEKVITPGSVIAALGHTGGTATCCAKAVCTRCSQSYGSLNAANHTGGTQLRGAASADCTAKGYTGDTYCLGCGKVISTGSAIAALGHTDGNGDGICDRCGELIQTEVQCSCDCHSTSFFTRFIWKLKVFFWKLFGAEDKRYCDCGAAHW